MVLSSGKRGWIRIAEAAIAIILLASVLLILIVRQAESNDTSLTMYKIQHSILDEASRNETLRNAVLREDTSAVASFIDDRLPPAFGFNVSICNPVEDCSALSGGSDIYTDDVIITASQQNYQPKKLKLYLWVIGRARNSSAS